MLFSQRRLSREDRLLRYCSRLKIDPALNLGIRELLELPLDWACLLQRAAAGRVSGLIYKALSEIGQRDKLVPQEAFFELRQRYGCQLGRNTLIARCLEDIFKLFEKNNIPAIAFKGPVLSELAYADIALRPMADLDILIKRKDLLKTDALLRERGFASAGSVADSLREVRYNAQRNSLLYLKTRPEDVNLHIYWHIVNFLPYDARTVKKINLEKIWQEAQPAPLAAAVKTFSLHHHLLYLCWHGCYNSFSPLVLLCDINEFMGAQKEYIDWEAFFADARAFGLSKYAYWGLFLAKKVFGTGMDERVLKRLRPDRISLLETEFSSAVLRNKFYPAELAFLGMNETMGRRALYLRRLFFPLKKEMAAIKQKDIVKVGPGDYFGRLSSALKFAFKFISSP